MSASAPSAWNSLGWPRYPALALILSSAALLAIGLSTPVMDLRMGLGDETYSVLTGIANLASGGNVLLAGVVFVFSVIFPIGKLIALFANLLLPMRATRRARNLRLLAVLGRWSMLDVFVIVVLVGSVQLGWLANGSPRAGIYLFAGAILLSMVATVVLQALVGGGLPPVAPSAGRWHERARVLAALLLYVLGLNLPLLDVQKWYWWTNELSVASALLRVADEGDLALALAMLVFVILLPCLRLLGLVWLHWGTPGARARGLVAVLDKWAMLDVFGLALLIVLVKIGDLASVGTRTGLWVLLLSIALSSVDSLRLQRERAR